jgi:hypothetical protein
MIYIMHYPFRNKKIISKKKLSPTGTPGLLYDGFQYIIHREAKSSTAYITCIMLQHLGHSCSQVGVDLKIAVLHIDFEIAVHKAVSSA